MCYKFGSECCWKKKIKTRKEKNWKKEVSSVE